MRTRQPCGVPTVDGRIRLVRFRQRFLLWSRGRRAAAASCDLLYSTSLRKGLLLLLIVYEQCVTGESPTLLLPYEQRTPIVPVV